MDDALSINTGLVRKILTEFIRSEIGRAGFSRAVVNLSGAWRVNSGIKMWIRCLETQKVTIGTRLPP